MIRDFCRNSRSIVIIKKKFRNIVKKLREISLKKSSSCPICGKSFKNAPSLKNHIEDSKEIDIYHKLFINNKVLFEAEDKDNTKKNSVKINNKPKFGKINVKKKKNIN